MTIQSREGGGRGDLGLWEPPAGALSSLSRLRKPSLRWWRRRREGGGTKFCLLLEGREAGRGGERAGLEEGGGRVVFPTKGVIFGCPG